MTTIGCQECAWGKVAGCWRCGSLIRRRTYTRLSIARRHPHWFARLTRGVA